MTIKTESRGRLRQDKQDIVLVKQDRGIKDMWINTSVKQLTVLFITAITLVSCAISIPIPTTSHGKDFNRVTEAQVFYGVTTKQEILELMGKPNMTTGESTSRPNITYLFFNRRAKALSPDQVASRLQSFYFDKSDKLTGMEYLSSFPDDSTYFDIDNAQKKNREIPNPVSSK